MSILTKIFGSRNSRMLRTLKPIVSEINALESHYQAMSDDELKKQTECFKKALTEGESLDDILPKTFAVVREAGKRVLNMRHFDVQLIGGIALHRGWVAEAKTGEGKTLMATLPAYLNALSGKGVHVIVPNSYLATRDAEWVGKIFTFLGLSVAAAINEDHPENRAQAYLADITYTTNNTLGFDYLRDNMRVEQNQKIQRDLNFCIVDEVDSILIDDARTPLIISGASEDSSQLYALIYKLIDTLNEESEVTIDVKDQLVQLTDDGYEKLQQALYDSALIADSTSLYDLENTNICHYVNACLKAKHLKKRDHHYVVDKNGITIIEENTGRKAVGRRWGDGIHQGIEAKEGVEIQKESQTLASITYQNLFRLYEKLSGMTGTADTEASELKDIYGLDVLVIPPNKPMVRKDLTDIVYLTLDAKTRAIAAEVEQRHKTGQPILIGTASIEYSEHLSTLLQEKNIPHSVLNAKQHEKEASIIAKAGCLNAVTIATNMAGRGTDIILGGCPSDNSNWAEENKAVLEAGGLHVLGSERHESRRIDNQLRGRSGRQGDKGSSQFYLSLDDRLIKYFASEKMVGFLKGMGNEDEPLSASMLSRSIENAQKNVENKYYDARKELLKLDDVANQQRKIIYIQRNELLATNDVSEIIESMVSFSVDKLIRQYLPGEGENSNWNITGLIKNISEQYGIQLDLNNKNQLSDIENTVRLALSSAIAERSKQTTPEHFQKIEQRCLMINLDRCWKEHLSAMDHLRQGINFRSYAQKNPTHEFKKDSFTLFEQMLEKIKICTVKHLCTLVIEQPKPKPQLSLGGNYTINVNPTQKKDHDTVPN